jgi:hyperosmotically inducible protein
MKGFGIRLSLFTLLFASNSLALRAQVPAAKKPSGAEEKASISLSHEIQHQIRVIPFYSVFDFVIFSLEGTKVTLTGYVLRRTLKEHAEANVRDIEGVTSVVNHIEVLPTSSSDDELRRAIYRALYEDSTLARYAVQNVPPVHIIVKNGTVNLEGVIDSLSDKNLAASRTHGVPNIASVQNNLLVHVRESAAE